MMYEELVERLREADEKSMCGECGLNLHTGATKKGVLFAEAADAIEELSKPRWIPVTERLPGAEQVLINLHYSDGINEVSLGEHWNCPDDPMEDGWGGFGGNGVVTHWMPLPQPPKEVT